MKKHFTVSVLGKKLDFSIIQQPDKQYGELYLLSCDEIYFNDVFDAEDLARFIASQDFEFFIADELRRQQEVKNRRIQIRVSEEEQEFIEKKAIKNGYNNVASYLRNLALG